MEFVLLFIFLLIIILPILFLVLLIKRNNALKKSKADNDALKVQINEFEEKRRKNVEEYKKNKAELESQLDTVTSKLQETYKKLDDYKKQYAELKNSTDHLWKYTPIADVEAETERITTIANDEIEKTKDELKKLESLAKALKNTINGYGDEWIIPHNQLLDTLANEYSFTDAGQELKKARENTKKLFKNKDAADCLYVEENRRTTAINFVLDAFNGKVDSILSRVKHNNYGKLKQELTDSFELVNLNGKAFRDARITQSYFESRLNELKWAVAVQEIILREREEQRAINEQLREEEKARREYEKAIRDAEKEEKIMQQAIEKAMSELSKANDSQKELLEKQLQELHLKLQEVEEKNKRALSMAQQTKSGHVYIISNIGSFGENVFKIGMTRRLEPLDRVKELGDASVPFLFDVHAMIFSDDAPTLERELHKAFEPEQLNKVNSRKEFFELPITKIKQKIDELGIQAHWTLSAEAKEYRESLALKRKQTEHDWI